MDSQGNEYFWVTALDATTEHFDIAVLRPNNTLELVRIETWLEKDNKGE